MSFTPDYATLRRSLKTGDLLLFSGKSLASDSIKWATFSPWSHVGLVLRLPEHPFTCLWEASPDADLPCLDRGLPAPGAQLVPLEERLQRYPGSVGLRRLQGTRLRLKDLTALQGLRRQLTGRPYERNLLELAAAAYDGPGGAQKENLASLFCSELVAEAYQALGLLGGGTRQRPSNEYTPADFSERHENLPWQRGRLGPERLLKL